MNARGRHGDDDDDDDDDVVVGYGYDCCDDDSCILRTRSNRRLCYDADRNRQAFNGEIIIREDCFKICIQFAEK